MTARSKESVHDSGRHTPHVRGMRGACAHEQMRAPTGWRVYVNVTGATTQIDALRRDGSTAVLALDGATDAAVIEPFVHETLCPPAAPRRLGG